MHNLLSGYVFWTIFSALPPMIWFYPLNQLKLSGYEAFVLVLFAPTVLLFKSLVHFVQSTAGHCLLNLLIAVTLLSFQARETFYRLCIVAVGAALCSVKLAADLSQWKEHSKLRSKIVQGYTTGFVAMLASRVAFRTLMPAFNDELTNRTICAVACINVFIEAVRQFSSPESVSLSSPATKRAPIRKSGGHLLAAISFGSLLYLKLALFGEISIPFRWLVAGRPEQGPDPNPFALLILICLLIGYFCGIYYEALISDSLWHVSGCLAFWALYKLESYEGSAGACLLAIYVGSLWIHYCERAFATCTSPALPFLLAMIFYLLPAFYSVWTVAYNFVPLGTYSREFTGLLIVWVCFWLMLDVYPRKPIVFLPYELSARNKRFSFWSHISIWFIIACLAMTHRYVNYSPGIDVETKDHVTVMLWTYHFGYDNDGWPSLERSAKLISDIDADVVGLLETDASRLYMGNNDLAQWLSEKLNMYVDYGPATKKHTWGCMLLSKYPIIESYHHLLPSPQGELAPALSAVLDVRGQRLTIVLTHMGNDRDDLDRRLQAEALSNITSRYVKLQYATILLAYVTSYPYQRDYNAFTTFGLLKDVDPEDRQRFCEYIFYANLRPLAYGRISKGRLSDTEIQTAKFALNLTQGVNYVTTAELDRVPKNWRYSAIFGPFFEGHYSGDDHRFHMWTPKYFVPREESILRFERS